MAQKRAKRSKIDVKNTLSRFFSFALRSLIARFPEPYSTRLSAQQSIVLQNLRARAARQLSMVSRMRAIRYGFTPDLFLLYGLDRGGNPADYLNEVSRVTSRLINDQPEYLDNKKLFYEYLSEIGMSRYLPDLYVELSGLPQKECHQKIHSTLMLRGRAVLKKSTGGGGEDVYICSLRNGVIECQGGFGDKKSLDEIMQSESHYLVTEYCNQGSYISDVYSESANTIRLITLRISESEVIVPAAVHRIGSKKTGMLDSFSQGGMSALIDLGTGELSAAAERYEDQVPMWRDVHPDTGARIKGVGIPGWCKILDDLKAIAIQASRFRYVGWDIIVTAPGEFKIIEGNSYPNPRVIQVHQPLLEDVAVRTFYRAHKVVW